MLALSRVRAGKREDALYRPNGRSRTKATIIGIRSIYRNYSNTVGVEDLPGSLDQDIMKPYDRP
jgi:hypothetical protein